MCSHPQNRLSNSPSFFIMDDKQFDQFVDQMMDQEQIDDDMDLGAYQDYHDYMLKLALKDLITLIMVHAVTATLCLIIDRVLHILYNLEDHHGE